MQTKVLTPKPDAEWEMTVGIPVELEWVQDQQPVNIQAVHLPKKQEIKQGQYQT
jgi:hypothetical protein